MALSPFVLITCEPKTGSLHIEPKIGSMEKGPFRQSIHTPPYVAVRTFLKKQKNLHNLSNRQLGAKLDTAYSLVAKVESGDRRLDVVEACKYCKALDIDPHDLIDVILEKLP